MAKKLFIKIDMFNLNQDVLLTQDNDIEKIASVPIDSVGKIVCSLAGEKNVEEIEIDGNQEYIQKVGLEVLEGLENYYTDRNVRIKLNGKVFN